MAKGDLFTVVLLQVWFAPDRIAEVRERSLFSMLEMIQSVTVRRARIWAAIPVASIQSETRSKPLRTYSCNVGTPGCEPPTGQQLDSNGLRATFSSTS